MTHDINSNNLPDMENIPKTFQVNMKVCNNMTSDDPWMTSG